MGICDRHRRLIASVAICAGLVLSAGASQGVAGAATGWDGPVALQTLGEQPLAPPLEQGKQNFKCKPIKKPVGCILKIITREVINDVLPDGARKR